MHALELQLRLASWKDPAVDVGIVVSELNIFGEHFHKTNPLVNFLLGWLRAVLAIEVTVGQLLPRQVTLFRASKRKCFSTLGANE